MARRLVQQGLVTRLRSELVVVSRNVSIDVSGSRSEISRRLGARLLKSGEVVVEECAGGPRLAPKSGRDLLSVLEGLDWKHLGAGRRREASRESGGSFVLGTTLGVAGSRGYDSVANVGVSRGARGASRSILKEGYYFAKYGEQLRLLWRLCRAAVASVDPGYRFTSLQVNRDFDGRPHVDRNDVSYQYALSLGHFTGGRLVVATDDLLRFRILDTHLRVTRCDGRHPHWVTKYVGGPRYSLVMYRVEGRGSERESNLRGRCRPVPIVEALPRRYV